MPWPFTFIAPKPQATKLNTEQELQAFHETQNHSLDYAAKAATATFSIFFLRSVLPNRLKSVGLVSAAYFTIQYGLNQHQLKAQSSRLEPAIRDELQTNPKRLEQDPDFYALATGVAQHTNLRKEYFDLKKPGIIYGRHGVSDKTADTFAQQTTATASLQARLPQSRHFEHLAKKAGEHTGRFFQNGSQLPEPMGEACRNANTFCDAATPTPGFIGRGITSLSTTFLDTKALIAQRAKDGLFKLQEQHTNVVIDAAVECATQTQGEENSSSSTPSGLK